MATKKTNQQLTDAVASGEGDLSVGKIRDILFGAHIKDYESRFVELETKIDKDTQRLGKSIGDRVDRLEATLREELVRLGTTLSDALAKESKERRQDREDSVADLVQFDKQTRERATDIEEAQSNDAQEVRNAMAEQGSEIKALIEDTRNQLLASLRQESGQLTHDKIGRDRLAGMLVEMADRMSAEPDPPAAVPGKSKARRKP